MFRPHICFSCFFFGTFTLLSWEKILCWSFFVATYTLVCSESNNQDYSDCFVMVWSANEKVFEIDTRLDGVARRKWATVPIISIQLAPRFVPNRPAKTDLDLDRSRSVYSTAVQFVFFQKKFNTIQGDSVGLGQLIMN